MQKSGPQQVICINSQKVFVSSRKLKNLINPVDRGLDKQAYNIVTGKDTSQDRCNFLLIAEEVGNLQRGRFIAECVADKDRFEKFFKTNKILTFGASFAKMAISFLNKIQQVRKQIDLFRKMLTLSLDENINVDKIIYNSTTPMPMSLCHTDGTMLKPDKSLLIKMWKNKIT